MVEGQAAYDRDYEWKAVALLSLGFGLVSVDRFMIMPLFPVIARELQLNYVDLGMISGALAVSWGAAALFWGNLSDRIGHRKVIIGSIIAFSLLVGLSGIATGLLALLVVRVLMGLADGAFTPVSISATIAASAPSRHGFNLGLQQMMSPLLGLAITPLLVTQLLKFIDWRLVFLLLAIPGLVLAALMGRVLREYGSTAVTGPAFQNQQARKERRSILANWATVIRWRNPPILIGCMLCWLVNLAVNSTLMPSYLLDVHHFNLQQAGMILSAFGFGGALGSLVFPALSDRLGRKPVMIFSAFGACLSLILSLQWAGSALEMFCCMFVMAMFNATCITLTVGPLATESVPPSLMATSSGMIIGFGEIFGGGISPVIVGQYAQSNGLFAALHAGPVALGVGLILALLLTETAPCR